MIQIIKLFETLKNTEIDNNKITLPEIKAKLTEEYKEVIKEIDQGIDEDEQIVKLLMEVFDLVQVIILLLMHIALKNKGFQRLLEISYNRHINKLVGRKWKFKGYYKVEYINSFRAAAEKTKKDFDAKREAILEGKHQAEELAIEGSIRSNNIHDKKRRSRKIKGFQW